MNQVSVWLKGSQLNSCWNLPFGLRDAGWLLATDLLIAIPPPSPQLNNQTSNWGVTLSSSPLPPNHPVPAASHHADSTCKIQLDLFGFLHLHSWHSFYVSAICHLDNTAPSKWVPYFQSDLKTEIRCSSLLNILQGLLSEPSWNPNTGPGSPACLSCLIQVALPFAPLA